MTPLRVRLPSAKMQTHHILPKLSTDWGAPKLAPALKASLAAQHTHIGNRNQLTDGQIAAPADTRKAGREGNAGGDARDARGKLFLQGTHDIADHGQGASGGVDEDELISAGAHADGLRQNGQEHMTERLGEGDDEKITGIMPAGVIDLFKAV